MIFDNLKVVSLNFQINGFLVQVLQTFYANGCATDARTPKVQNSNQFFPTLCVTFSKMVKSKKVKTLPEISDPKLSGSVFTFFDFIIFEKVTRRAK